MIQLSLDTPADDALRRLGQIADDLPPFNPAPLRDLLADPTRQAVAAALIVLDAQLRLDDGQIVPIESRLLHDGGVDIDGHDGAPAAIALQLPCPSDRLSAIALAADLTIGLAISLTLQDSAIDQAGAVLIGVAAHPLRARQIEGALRGRRLTDPVINVAAQTARAEAQPYGVGDVVDPETVDAVESLCRQTLGRLRQRIADAGLR